MSKFPKFPSSTWKNCRKHDEKWSFLGFMCLMYTFREVIPHNIGTCRKPLGSWPSPPKKNMYSLMILYIIWGYKLIYVHLWSPPNDQKDPTVLVMFLFSSHHLLFEPTQLHFRPALKGFWVTAPWFCLIFGPLSMGPGAEVWVFLFFSGPKTEQAFREFSSPPLGWMSIHVFWIWMIKSWINDDLLTDLMLDKAIFSIILFVGLLVKIQPRKSHHFPLGMFMDSIQIDSGILRGGMHHLWNSGAIVFTTDHKFPWETRLCLRKKLERSSNTSEIK